MMWISFARSGGCVQFLTLAVVGWCLIPAARAWALGANVIVNGSFEESSTECHVDSMYAIDKAPSAWSLVGEDDDYEWTRGVDYEWIDGELMPWESIRHGKRCIKINGSWNVGTSGPRIMNDKLCVPRNLDSSKYYLFQCWYRTVGVEHADFIVRIDHYSNYPENPSSSPSWIWRKKQQFTPSVQWKQVSMVIRPFQAGDAPFAYDSEEYPNFNGSDAFRVALGLNNSPGSLYVDDISLRPFDPDSSLDQFIFPPNAYQVDPPTVDANRPVFSPSDFYTVRKDNRGTSWIVRPDGDPVWLIGVNNVEEPTERNPIMQSWIDSNYASIDDYTEDSRIKLDEWHFTAESYNDTPGSKRFGRADIKFFSFSGSSWVKSAMRMKKANGSTWKPGGGDGHLADPYNPDWQARARQEVWENLSDSKLSDPEFFGYYTDNLAPVMHLYQGIWSDHCAPVFTEFIKGRYNTPQDVAAAWSSHYHTFQFSQWDDIYDAREEVTIHGFDDSPALIQDLIDFEKKVWKDYARVVCGLLREREAAVFGADKDGVPFKKHLIFTNRLSFNGMPNDSQWWIERLFDAYGELNAEIPGFYFDIAAFNHYPGSGHLPTHKAFRNMAFLEDLNRRSGLPAFASEFAVGASDTEFPTTSRWSDRTIDTQADRGLAYQNLLYTWSRLHFYVGGMWYQWFDGIYDTDGHSQNPNIQSYDPIDPAYDGRNSGLVDPHNQPYQDFIAKVQETNLLLKQTSRANAVGVLDFPWDTAGGYAPVTPNEAKIYHFVPNNTHYLTWSPSTSTDVWNNIIHASSYTNRDFTEASNLGPVALYELPPQPSPYYRVSVRDAPQNDSIWTDVIHLQNAQSLQQPILLEPLGGQTVRRGDKFVTRWLPPAPGQSVSIRIERLVNGSYETLLTTDWMDNSGFHETILSDNLPDGVQMRVVLFGGTWDGSSFQSESDLFTYVNPDLTSSQNGVRFREFY